MKRKLASFSLLLALALILTAVTPSVHAAKGLSDTSGHWAKSYIDSAVARGYVKGYEDGTFKPNAPITRAEFCKMLNSALGLTATTTISFKDVPSSKWYYSDVQKSVAAGYISGYSDGTFGGDSKITRQEAAVVISRIVTAAGTTKDISALRDSKSIASWALDGAKTVYSKNYMGGDNLKRFNPSGKLTRAEAVKIIESLIKSEKVTKTNLTVAKGGQTYSNTVFVGSVIISPDIGEGTVTFNNCRILGTMLVNGGGSSSIRLSNTRISNMTVNSPSTRVGVACAGTSTVRNTYVSTPCNLAEGGLSGGGKGFENVTLGGNGLSSQTVSLNGDFDSVTVSAVSGLHLLGGEIDELTINSAAAGSAIELDQGTTVTKAVINAGCAFIGKGSVKEAVQSAANVTYETRPLKITDPTSSTGFKVSTYPENGDKYIPVSDAITLMFTEAVTNADGGAINAAYIQNVVELRRDSTSGAKVTYYPTVSANGKAVSLQPMSVLKEDATYYLTVKAGAFRSSKGQLTDALTVRFSTGDGENQPMVPTVTPADGSENIPVTASIKLEFGAEIYNSNGKSLTSTYLNSDVLELRRGSSGGKEVAFDAKLSKDGKTITVTPDDEFDTDTTYYLILLDGALTDGEEENSRQTFSFTTSEEAYCVPMASPSSGAEDVDLDQVFTFTFDSALSTTDGSKPTNTYIGEAVVSMRKDSEKGSSVSLSVSISSDKKTITVTPYKNLVSDTDYYIIFEGGSLVDGNGDDLPDLVFRYTTKSDSSFSGNLAPTTSPTNGKTGVKTSTDITITYPQSLTTDTGKDITSSYLEDAITIRKSSATGKAVAFSAKINSAAKVITLTPDDDLTNNTKYYVTVSQGVFKNASGSRNAKYTFSFTVGRSSSYFEPYETYPEDGDRDVSTSTDITIDFDEAVYQTGGKSVTSTYLKNDVVELRKSGTSGTKVSFTASIDSKKKSITISPSSSLTSGTKYYVILNGDTLENGDGEVMDEYIFSFTTRSSSSTAGTISSPTMFPANGETAAEVTTSQIQLIYPDALTNSDGKALTSDYLEDYFKITSGTATVDKDEKNLVRYTAKIDSGNKRITLNLSDDLKCDTKYYVSLPAGILKSSKGTSAKLSYYFTTKKPTVEITDDDIVPDKLSAEVTFRFDYTGAEDVDFTVYRGSTAVRANFTPNTSPKSSYTVTLDELKEATTYNVKVTMTYNGGKTVSVSKSFKTLATSTQSTPEAISVEDFDGTSYDATLAKPSKNKAKAEIKGKITPKNGQIPVTVTLFENSKSTVEINGARGSSALIDVDHDATAQTVIIKVTAESGDYTEYTLTIPIAQ